ncbi:hypothetical protein CSPX01_06271 [Colletotrichum filicis]|nr:hypothetical protein CSPX01_06271 [Colletotrichum filicis]
MAAANLVLDERYDTNQLPNEQGDHNAYILGRIRDHKVAIACLPNGIYGTNPAAIVAKDMLRTFKSIRFGLLVGIGGGVPSRDQDIRLGDVVISIPSKTSGGVIQYDRGKKREHGDFERTGSLNSPPTILLAALSHLQGLNPPNLNCIPEIMSEALEQRREEWKTAFAYQGETNDRLFRTGYEHVHAGSDCSDCDG